MKRWKHYCVSCRNTTIKLSSTWCRCWFLSRRTNLWIRWTHLRLALSLDQTSSGDSVTAWVCFCLQIFEFQAVIPSDHCLLLCVKRCLTAVTEGFFYMHRISLVRVHYRIQSTHTHTQPFSRTTWVSWSQKNKLLDLRVQGKIAEADTSTIQLNATPSGLISGPSPSSPIFTLDALPATTLPIYPSLGQAPNMLACILSDFRALWYIRIQVMWYGTIHFVCLKADRQPA